MVEITKLDTKDKKILALLDENSRYSNSQIARKVGLSKPAVEYRLKRFEKNQVIFNFYTLINFAKLGYSQYKIYLKFHNTNLEDEERIITYLTKINSMWIAKLRGNWDLAVSILAKNNYELGRIVKKFMNNFSKFILKKDILLTEYSPVFSRSYLPGRKGSEFVYGIPSEIYSLDDSDLKIVKEMSTNARISILDLARKTKLSRDIVNYRMKKLIRDNIFIQFSAYPNLKNIGINHYKIILRTINFDDKTEKELRDYVSEHKKITQFLKLIGSWDAEVEFETESEEELYILLNELRNKFSNIIRDFEVLRIAENYKFSFFPI